MVDRTAIARYGARSIRDRPFHVSGPIQGVLRPCAALPFQQNPPTQGVYRPPRASASLVRRWCARRTRSFAASNEGYFRVLTHCSRLRRLQRAALRVGAAFLVRAADAARPVDEEDRHRDRVGKDIEQMDRPVAEMDDHCPPTHDEKARPAFHAAERIPKRETRLRGSMTLPIVLDSIGQERLVPAVRKA